MKSIKLSKCYYGSKELLVKQKKKTFHSISRQQKEETREKRGKREEKRKKERERENYKI